jgi:hypothetical protein
MSNASNSWIVVVVRDNLDLLRDAIASFDRQDVAGGVRVLCVDNGSGPDVVSWLRCHPDITTIHFNPQHSVSRAWNAALKYLFSLSGSRFVERVLVANSDVVLRPDTWRLLENEQADFVTGVGNSDPACVKPAAPQRASMPLVGNIAKGLMRVHGVSETDIAAAQQRVSEQAVRGGYPLPNPDMKRPHPDFSCFMISRWCYAEVGEFDECFVPAFYEDNSFHVRMHRAGIRAYSIDLPFFHVGGGSQTIKRAAEDEQERLSKYAARNRDLFVSMYGCDPADTKRYERLFGMGTFGIGNPPQGQSP